MYHRCDGYLIKVRKLSLCPPIHMSLCSPMLELKGAQLVVLLLLTVGGCTRKRDRVFVVIALLEPELETCLIDK